MVSVIVIAEGVTEERFIKDLVAPALRHLNVFVKPVQLNTSASARGGAVTIERLKFYARNHLRGNEKPYVSTLIDLYALDTDFPGHADAQKKRRLEDKVALLNNALHSAIVAHTKCPPDRFIAHIQPYEFEALLFSSATALTSIEPSWAQYSGQIEKIRKDHESPEHINGGSHTHPSRRLDLLKSPTFHKARHGPLAAEKITLATIEQECRHFRGWMDKLRALGN